VLLLAVYLVIVRTLSRELVREPPVESLSHSRLVRSSWRVLALVVYALGINVSIAFASSAQTLWLASPPYSAPPLAVSVAGVLFNLSLIAGTAAYAVLSAWLGHVYALVLFAPTILVHFALGPTPCFLPDVSQSLPTAYALHVLVGLSVAPVVSTPVHMMYILTHVVQLRREECAAPTASVCAATPLLGLLLGPLVSGPLIDSFGLRYVYTGSAFVALASMALMLVAMWPYRSVMRMGEAIEAKPATHAHGDEKQKAHKDALVF